VVAENSGGDGGKRVGVSALSWGAARAGTPFSTIRPKGRSHEGRGKKMTGRRAPCTSLGEGDDHDQGTFFRIFAAFELRMGKRTDLRKERKKRRVKSWAREGSGDFHRGLQKELSDRYRKRTKKNCGDRRGET